VAYCFLFGGLAAVLVQQKNFSLRNVAWLAPLGLVAWFFAAPLPRLAQYAFLFVFFVGVVEGWSAFGLLRSRPAKVLGLASYSLYLTHCIVLYVVIGALDHQRPVAELSLPAYWAFAALAALAAVALSTLTYRRIEFPFLHPQPAPIPPHSDRRISHGHDIPSPADHGRPHRRNALERSDGRGRIPRARPVPAVADRVPPDARRAGGAG
jgi:peptidoglycan/LPS O-acetylase OafA/YrhL